MPYYSQNVNETEVGCYQGVCCLSFTLTGTILGATTPIGVGWGIGGGALAGLISAKVVDKYADEARNDPNNLNFKMCNPNVNYGAPIVEKVSR